MAVYDVFPFFNELDLLEIRMEILDPYVDYFVIGECNKTFQGNNKPFYFLENQERFSKFKSKIIHNKFIDDKGDQWNNWDRDKNHKNYLSNALLKCNDKDIIILSDADEIANPEVLIKVIEKFEFNKLFVFEDQDYCCYYLNTKIDNHPWPGTRICDYNLFKNNSFDELRNTESMFWKNNKDKIIRILSKDFRKSTGWHYTNLGGVNKIIYKIESWGHQELNNDSIKRNIEKKLNSLTDFIGRPGFDANKFELNSINCSKYILNNLDKYKHLILG